MTTEESDRLRLDAVDAKYGSENVQSRLRNMMEVGSPSIADLAYAIRIRIKDDYRIIDKVLRKRVARPDYGVKELRDIVGLRIVTLYRLDALDIIPKLLDMIERPDTDGTGLFVGRPDPGGTGLLVGKLEEIKIYSTNPAGDAQALPQRLSELFSSYGYKNAEVQGTPSNYSSIHIVVWCRSHYAGVARTIPLEIQIRTVFEDAWSEIDHRLKYKPEDGHFTLREQSDLESCLRHLNVMKTMIDGVAQYADQIRVQEQEVRGAKLSITASRTIEDTRSFVRGMKNVPAHVRAIIDHALDSQADGMHSSRKAARYASNRVGSLKHAAAAFQEAIDTVATELPAACEDRKALSYYLPMERALCLYQLGGELQSNEYLADAVRIYKEVQVSHPERAIAYYRLARALAAMGDYPSAIAQFREAKSRLNTDSTVPARHWVRAAIPRNLGYSLWQEAESRAPDPELTMPPLLSKPDHVGEPDTVRLNLYLDAYDVTASALTENVEPDPSSPEFDKGTRSRGLLINNIVSYALDFLNAGGNVEDLRNRGFTTEQAQGHVKEIYAQLSNIDMPQPLDTLLRASTAFKVEIDRRTVANKLKSVLLDLGIDEKSNKRIEREMLFYANGILAELDKKDVGT